jgi:hypothetical protein
MKKFEDTKGVQKLQFEQGHTIQNGRQKKTKSNYSQACLK